MWLKTFYATLHNFVFTESWSVLDEVSICIVFFSQLRPMGIVVFRVIHHYKTQSPAKQHFSETQDNLHIFRQ